MEKKRWIGYILFPLIMVVFCAVATYLYYLPDIRFEKAKKAFESGNYEEASDLAEKENSLRAAELSEALKLEQARKLVEDGNTAEARSILESLPETEETSELIRSLDYADAVGLFDMRKWNEAVEAMEQLHGYRDSYQYIDRAKTEIAEEYYQNGDIIKAVDAFLAAGTDESNRRAYEIAKEETGIDDPEEALEVLRGYDEETITKLRQMRRLRKETEWNVLSAGFAHTVGLKADQTVLATGDNTYGQCEVESWSGIIEVAAGAYHSVGLKQDGTAVSAGDNSYGQCDVSSWSDIVHISANNYDTFALTRDGRILHTGFHAYPNLASWPSDVVSVSSGSYAIAAVRKNGQMLSSHESSYAKEFEGLISCAVQTGYVLGVTEDGSTLAHGVSLPEDWNEIVILYAGSNRILALTAEQTVLEYAFMDRDRLLTEPQSHVIAAANGATHVALLYDDGTVRCFGNNWFGECNTENWNMLG